MAAPVTSFMPYTPRLALTMLTGMRIVLCHGKREFQIFDSLADDVRTAACSKECNCTIAETFYLLLDMKIDRMAASDRTAPADLHAARAIAARLKPMIDKLKGTVQ